MVYRRLKILKGHVDEAFKPLAKMLGSAGVKPTHLTILSIPFGLFGAWFIFEMPVAASFSVLFYFTCDFMDGTLARVNKSHSDFGSALDFSVDRLVACAFLVSYFVHSGAVLLPVVGLALIVLVSLEEFGFKFK